MFLLTLIELLIELEGRRDISKELSRCWRAFATACHPESEPVAGGVLLPNGWQVHIWHAGVCDGSHLSRRGRLLVRVLASGVWSVWLRALSLLRRGNWLHWSDWLGLGWVILYRLLGGCWCARIV